MKRFSRKNTKRKNALFGCATQTGISRLLKKRKNQFKTIGITSAATGGITGLAAYGNASTASVRTGNPVNDVAPIVANSIAIGLIIGAITGARVSASEIRQATIGVGKVLGEEAQERSTLKQYLEKHKYVIINKRGEIVGTNKQRLFGLGRIRLDTKKILHGDYK